MMDCLREEKYELRNDDGLVGSGRSSEKGVGFVVFNDTLDFGRLFDWVALVVVKDYIPMF
jgi:hypothetical protein